MDIKLNKFDSELRKHLDTESMKFNRINDCKHFI